MAKPPYRRIAAPVFGALLMATAMAQDAVRPEVGKPLQAANELIRAQRFKDALARVRDADAVAGKSPGEGLLVERMRLAASIGAGDVEAATRSFEVVSPRLGPTERLKLMENLADASYRSRDWGKCVQWSQRYFKEGGTAGRLRTLLVQSLYLAGDHAGVVREARADVAQLERSGTPPGEDLLKLLANAALKQGDNEAYLWTLERLVAHHARREYWLDLLSRLQRKPGFSDRLALDTYRLALAAGAMGSANDYMEMAQLALQAGLAGEALQVIDKGIAAGMLGQGRDAERANRLRELASRRQREDQERQPASLAEARTAKDGSALVDAGLRLVAAGERRQGLALMQEGIERGRLKRENDAKLHLAYALVQSGDGARAATALQDVHGSDGTADLARLWGLLLRRKPQQQS